MLRGFIAFLFLSLWGCQFFQPKEQSAENPIARVYTTNLYPSELEGLIPAGITAGDSAKFAEKFVNDWIRKQLMISRAEEEVDLNEAEIDQKVLDYRYALTRSAYEKKYILENLNEEVTDGEIQEYYESHSEDFVLKQNIVRCLFAQMPKEAPRQRRFEKNFQTYPESDLNDLRDHTAQYANRAFLEDSLWVDFNEVIGGTPFDQILDKNRILRTRKYLKEVDDNFDYYLRVLEYKMVDDVSPLEFVKENIKNILINKRKIALKRELEEKVYNEAARNNAFEIFDR
ncbi:MAG: peptidyl-prolyl cis-trans isomerase [Flavobacteriales bacterium]|nr:peptidyl-prolyl cis-trans isomerase [Flavobacteriales bacterium]